jgi:hypothetical protein
MRNNKSTKEHAKEHAKDIAIIAGGTALGAGAAYGLSRAMRSEFGRTFARMDPKDRLKFIAPMLGAAATAGSIAHMQQKANSYREKTASYYLEDL